MMRSIWIGYDPRETSSFAVARHSIARRLREPIHVFGVVLDRLISDGLYTRPIETRRSALDRPIMWDVISEAPMSTQHANARFLVPHLARQRAKIPPGWAMFLDGDTLARTNLARAFDGLDHSKAVYCVKHQYAPPPGVKMDGQQQTRYARKNWSSFMIFNCGHESNAALTPAMVNSLPGRDLHRFCWLKDEEIGELGAEWNWLVGHSSSDIDPKIVHFTEGCPDMPGYENVPYAAEWRKELNLWAA